ncbi:hypothetical protein Ga0100230_008065 [Opitutaceae bacterium TAV3]|nr:hypothetical protein Ga0100230_008065 [Opitutaceae bacterium TAV3]
MNTPPPPPPPAEHAELLILPDGRILAHNITPALAAVLSQLAPHDTAMRHRAQRTPQSTAAPSIPQTALHIP